MPVIPIVVTRQSSALDKTLPLVIIDLMKAFSWLLRLIRSKLELQDERLRTRRSFIASYDDGAPVEYERRVVAFLDILGWSQAVENSVTDSALRQRLLNAVWLFAARVDSYVEVETEAHPSRDECTQFSDSLIVSFPYNSHRDLFRLLKFVTEFQSSMLLLKLPLRGGVTVGSLFHKDVVAFGPAMIQAYRLESEVAKMPRIIIDPALDDEVEAAAANLPAHWPFVTRAGDKYYETDFLTNYAMKEKMVPYIDRQINEWLEEYKDNERVLNKYIWLNNRWNAAKADAAWRVDIRDKLYSERNVKHGMPNAE